MTEFHRSHTCGQNRSRSWIGCLKGLARPHPARDGKSADESEEADRSDHAFVIGVPAVEDERCSSSLIAAESKPGVV